MENEEFYKKFGMLDVSRLNGFFNAACMVGDLNEMKYLLTSKDLSQHANVRNDDCYGFRSACMNGHVEAAKYLLTSEDLKEHADIHASKDDSFRQASKFNQWGVLRFLIFDMEIKKTEDIKRHLWDYENRQVEEWFKLREFNEQLGKELTCKKPKVNKVKV